ncbi:hypothetical protein SPRG_20466 [Saprolegnia parasitica CBS 223.65]|uniref:Uncharacterized protein n=1 Tax=Saprolegnia parasitica (strain CBS 223.65) TaxID=695850 RepID=A0A067C839_SAPPC|nr:hypothetical protein SPRG_20466 [Saprolegnia parasitica CBS 223.65]KDO26663.1 hypothetical protein SPRG_20466 [Saprolegnia parasitica CBS 223.65]|eukprot:XP_012202561.1 hypothetical protein SPRG_20466 [Saprolegnia parasitica CBS 223.65]
MSEVCILKGRTISRWWSSGSQDYQLYLGVVLLFFSLVIALPMAKFGLFLLRYVTGDVYLKPDEAHEMLLSSGSRRSCAKWPLWVFGVPLLLWVNAVGNVYRLITVRKGSAKTLLHEGVTVLKILVLVILFYFIYILVFPGIAENIIRAFFTGFCSLVALATVPVVRNVTGSQFILFNHALRQRLHVSMASTPPGMLLDVPLGYVITTCDAYSKTYVPAGKALTTPLVVFAENTPEADEPRWPLRLRIRLPPTLHVAAVRRFLQDVDRRLRKADERAALHPHRNAMFAATAAAPTLLRKQPPPTREEDRLCVSIEGRWVVHVFGDIAAKSREVFRDRLSQKVQLMMSIVESHALTANVEQA